MGILISRGHREYGPYTLAQTRKYVAAGQLRTDDLAWTEGLPDWTRLAAPDDEPRVSAPAY